MMNESTTGICFNIQHYSVHDGAGIRTTVFVKGCPLRCAWCSNPESQKFEAELAFNKKLCIHCGTCASRSRSGVVSMGDKKEVLFHPEKQVPEDLALSECCPSQALFCYGKKYSVEEVMQNVLQESIFYAYSSGGLTVSGGEPLCRPLFTRSLLSEARRHRLKTAVETCGCYELNDRLDIFALLDELYFDIKVMDAEMHRRMTGAGNKQILANIKAIRRAFPALSITIRTPVVPGVNDNIEAVSQIARFVRDEIPGAEYELLKFHRFGEAKYRYLGRRYLYNETKSDDVLFSELTSLSREILTKEKCKYYDITKHSFAED